MRFDHVRFGLLSTVCAGACMAVTPAYAQGGNNDAAAEQDATSGPTIVVTARKREESLIDVPLAVSVATAEQLKRDQITNVNDLQRIAPALEVSQTFGGETNGGGRLRGVGTGVFNPSVASSVALVIDQVPVGNLNFPLLYDMAQVEVLRGPQGTLFGQGASSGVLNISTRRPEFDRYSINGGLDFADKGTAGSEVGELIANAGANMPLASNLALRVATQFKRESGLQRSATTGEDNVIEDLGIRGRLRWEPAASVSVLLTGEYGRETSDGQTFMAISKAPDSTRPFGPPGATLGAIATAAYLNPAGCALPEITPRAEHYCENAPTEMSLRMASVSAVVDVELTDALSLTSVSAFRDRTATTVQRDFSRLTTSPAARDERNKVDANGFSQELRLSYAGNGFDLVGGGYYTDFETVNSPTGDPPFTFGSNLPGQRIGFSVCTFAGTFCPVPTSFSQNMTENRTIAGFVDATVALSDMVDLFGGLRYDDYKNSTRIQTFAATTGPVTTFEAEDSNVSGRAGISFMPNPDVNLYASYSRGYKPPAVGTDPSGALFRLDPEKANAYELGAKFAVGFMQLTANAFYTQLKGFQSQTSVFVGTALVSRPINIPKLTSKGFELNAFGQLAPGLSVNAGYQFNILEYPAGFLGDDGGNLGGRQFINAPKHKFTLSGDYGVPVGNELELFLNANVVYKSKVLLAARANPDFVYPAHEIINGGFGIRDADGAWTASVFVRNLTKEREPTAYLASTFAGQLDGGIRAWPVAGLTARVVGVRLGFEF